MRLLAPTRAPAIPTRDTNGNVVNLQDGMHPTLLCFFRDPNCPFCNLRIFELTAHYQSYAAKGLRIVAVFSASPEEVRRFVNARRRPFPVVAEPMPKTLEDYGIESSSWRKWKGILTRIPTLLKGLRIVGLAGLRTSNLMPADFLLDETGKIVQAWYGTDAGDRIPLAQVDAFMDRWQRTHAIGTTVPA